MSELPETHAPSKRRRRWLIVAFVMVFVSMCSWWNWPRGDSRFVGKWEVQGQTGPQTFLTLSRNRFAEWAFPEAGFHLLASWRFDGKNLVIEPIGETLLLPIWKRLNSLPPSQLRTDFQVDSRVFEVSALDGSSFRAREVADGLPTFFITHVFLRAGDRATLVDPHHALWDDQVRIEAPDWDRIRKEARERRSE